MGSDKNGYEASYDAAAGAVQGADGMDLAEREFYNFLDANEIDHDEAGMEADDLESFLKMKKRFIRAAKEGRLVVDDTSLVYTVSKFSFCAGEKLTIGRPTGKDFMAMDGLKDSQQMLKFNALMSSLCGKDKSFVARLDIKDRQFLQDAAMLFINA